MWVAVQTNQCVIYIIVIITDRNLNGASIERAGGSVCRSKFNLIIIRRSRREERRVVVAVYITYISLFYQNV